MLPPKSIKKNSNGTYTAFYYVNRCRKQKTFHSRRLAEDYLLKQRFEKEKSHVYGRDNKVALSEVINQYRNEVKKSQNSKALETFVIARWEEFFNIKNLKHVSQLTKAHVAEYEAWRQKDKNLSQRTVNIDIKLLSAVLNHAWKHDRIIYNPIAKYPYKPEQKQFQRFLTAEEISKILRASHRHNLYSAIYAILTLGLRAMELCTLRFCDIKQDIVHIQPREDWSPKWGKSRWIPLDEEYVNDYYLIEYFKKGSGKDLCFPHPYFGGMMNGNIIYQYFKDILKESGVDNSKEVTLHMLRHTHISYMVARIGHSKHISLRTIMEYVGINDYKTIMRYSQAVKGLSKNLPDPEKFPWQIGVL